MEEKEKGAVVPRLRFPGFFNTGTWRNYFGKNLFSQISNKNHKSNHPILAITQEQGAIPRDLINYHVSVTDKSVESYKLVEVGDFIISLRSFQGGIEYSRYEGICSPAYVVLRLDENYSPDYFRHFLKCEQFIAQMNKNIEGLRDGKMVSYKQFSELQLPVPPSEKEQQKIADCLSSLDDLIAAQAQKLELLKAHKKALMQQLFPTGGGQQPRLRFPKFRNLGPWETKKLGELSETISGLTYRPEDVCVDGLLVLRSSNIQNGKITLNDNIYVRPNIRRANLLKKDDILICVRNGSKSLIGKNALIPDGMPLCTHGAFMTVLRSKSARFLIHLLQTDKYKNQVSADLGATINSINSNQLNKFIFFFPSINEQQKIADFLSSLDELIEAKTQKIDLHKTHKKALIQQLFPVDSVS